MHKRSFVVLLCIMAPELTGFLLGEGVSATLLQDVTSIWGALGSFRHWPIAIAGSVTWTSGGEAKRSEIVLRFRKGDSGASRVVYRGVGLVVKFASKDYEQDDNKSEYTASGVVPAWLIPKTFGFFKVNGFGTSATALVCESMHETVEAFLEGLMSVPPASWN